MIESILIFSAIGLALGIVLAYCSERFKVKSDAKEKKIYEALPHVDCGGCGYIGCREFAKALVLSKESPGKCMVADKEAIEEIAGIMKTKAEESERVVAFVRCRGGVDVSPRNGRYSGIKDCAAVSDAFGGDKKCSFGCLGYGSCEKVCKFGAIRIGKDGVAIVDPQKCVGCGVCVEACPLDLIIMRKEGDRVDVACINTESGGDTVKVCKIGCIACGICEKICKFGAIKVVNGVAVVDHSLCRNCGECVDACPRHIISIEKIYKGKIVQCVRDSGNIVGCDKCGLCK